MEGIVVVGMVMLLISGNFDLSVGSVMALAGIASAALMVKANVPPPIAVMGGLAVGAAAGAVNGFIVTKIGVNPLVATLGMMAVGRGLALGFTSGHPVIGVPIDSSALHGIDALFATVQMPPGVPVATMAIGRAGAKNAAILSAQIIGLNDPKVTKILREHKKKMVKEVEKKSTALRKSRS